MNAIYLAGSVAWLAVCATAGLMVARHKRWSRTAETVAQHRCTADHSDDSFDLLDEIEVESYEQQDFAIDVLWDIHHLPEMKA